jgi:hypothetical protein
MFTLPLYDTSGNISVNLSSIKLPSGKHTDCLQLSHSTQQIPRAIAGGCYSSLLHVGRCAWLCSATPPWKIAPCWLYKADF